MFCANLLATVQCASFPAALLTRDTGWVGGKKRSGKTGQTLPATHFPPAAADWGKHFSFLSRASRFLGDKKKQKSRLKDIMLILHLMERSQHIHRVEFRLLVKLANISFVSNSLKIVELSPMCVFSIACPCFFILGFAFPDCATCKPPKPPPQTFKYFNPPNPISNIKNDRRNSGDTLRQRESQNALKTQNIIEHQKTSQNIIEHLEHHQTSQNII